MGRIGNNATRCSRRRRLECRSMETSPLTAVSSFVMLLSSAVKWQIIDAADGDSYCGR